MRLSSRIAMPMIRDLLVEERATTAADTSIDQTLAELFGYEAMNGQWRVSEYSSWQDTPAFTDSVDAALLLVGRVLPGWDTDLHLSAGGNCIVSMTGPDFSDDDLRQYAESGVRPTGGLAICEALLSAKLALLTQEAGDA